MFLSNSVDMMKNLRKSSLPNCCSLESEGPFSLFNPLFFLLQIKMNVEIGVIAINNAVILLVPTSALVLTAIFDEIIHAWQILAFQK